MKENLLCYALLLNNKLTSLDKYVEYLNSAFLESPYDNLLLELQFLTSDLHSTIRLILKECYECTFDEDCFAIILLKELKDIYFSRAFPIEVFAKHVYSLWNSLPNYISYEPPLHILSYADDPLSWGDAQQTCDTYEALFEYYTHQD